MFDIIGVFNTIQMAVVSTQQLVLIYISTCVSIYRSQPGFSECTGMYVYVCGRCV